MRRDHLAVLVFACLLAAACRGSDQPPNGTPGSPGAPSAGTASPDTSATGPGSQPPATGNPDPGGSPTPPPGTGVPSIDPAAGVDWQLADASAFSTVDVISDAAALGPIVVTVGTSEDEDGIGRSAAWYSLDGYVWQPADNLPNAQDTSIDAVSAGPGGLVAVGFDYSGDVLVPAVWRSTDGRSWTRIVDADLARGQMGAVAGGAGGYVVLGSDFDDGTSLIWHSPDGSDWSAAEVVPGIDVGAAINGLSAIGRGYIAYGSSGDGTAGVWYTVDGEGWRLADGLGDVVDSTVNDVATSEERFVAVGARYMGSTARALIWTSVDGITWEAAATDLEGEMIGVDPVGAGFYAVGAVPEANELLFSAGVWASADGATWQRRPDHPSFQLARMIELLHAGPGLVIIGEKALDEAGEELAPAVWVGVPR